MPNSFNPLDCKEIKPLLKEISPKYSLEGLCWSWSYNTLASWCEELTHWKRSWCWERLRAGGERDDRGWDGWMALLTQWTWVWASSGRWWWTGKPGVLQSMGLQRVRYDWVTELNWTNICVKAEAEIYGKNGEHIGRRWEEPFHLNISCVSK